MMMMMMMMMMVVVVVGRRAFSVAGPMVWNLLPDHLRDPLLIIFSHSDERHLTPLWRFCDSVAVYK